MDKKKSLGSSPIGYQVGSATYSFIRDLGVSKQSVTTRDKGDDRSGSGDRESKIDQIASSFSRKVKAAAEREKEKEKQAVEQKTTSTQPSQEEVEKKVVSYYLEVDLVKRLKELANRQNEYYSTIVSDAIAHWIEKHW